jgi:Rieske Fe-S protein
MSAITQKNQTRYVVITPERDEVQHIAERMQSVVQRSFNGNRKSSELQQSILSATTSCQHLGRSSTLSCQA